jgi:hypothetical protein
MSISFRDAFAVVWEWEDKGKYALVKMGTSRKDKASGEYKNSNWSYVRFVGDAYKDIEGQDLQKKDRIIIRGGSFSREEYENTDGKRAWPKNAQITVFKWEYPTDADYPAKKDDDKKTEKKESKPKPSAPKRQPKMDEPPAMEDVDPDEFPF